MFQTTNQLKLLGQFNPANQTKAQVHETHAILQNIDLREKTQAFTSLQDQWDEKHHLNPRSTAWVVGLSGPFSPVVYLVYLQ